MRKASDEVDTGAPEEGYPDGWLLRYEHPRIGCHLDMSISSCIHCGIECGAPAHSIRWRLPPSESGLGTLLGFKKSLSSLPALRRMIEGPEQSHECLIGTHSNACPVNREMTVANFNRSGVGAPV
jgi:hypothetical protein